MTAADSHPRWLDRRSACRYRQNQGRQSNPSECNSRYLGLDVADLDDLPVRYGDISGNGVSAGDIRNVAATDDEVDPAISRGSLTRSLL